METLIMAEGVLTPSCSKSHIEYSFNIKDEKTKLEMYFSYEPKILEDREKSKELIVEGIHNFVDFEQEKVIDQWENYLPVQNLLTITVNDCKQFRGCAHRQSPKQYLFITEDNASQGLIAGKIIPGQWRITISVHAVVTDICKYKLHVLEG